VVVHGGPLQTLIPALATAQSMPSWARRRRDASRNASWLSQDVTCRESRWWWLLLLPVLARSSVEEVGVADYEVGTVGGPLPDEGGVKAGEAAGNDDGEVFHGGLVGWG
jgi:hypothetical protein